MDILVHIDRAELLVLDELFEFLAVVSSGCLREEDNSTVRDFLVISEARLQDVSGISSTIGDPMKFLHTAAMGGVE